MMGSDPAHPFAGRRNSFGEPIQKHNPLGILRHRTKTTRRARFVAGRLARQKDHLQPARTKRPAHWALPGLRASSGAVERGRKTALSTACRK